MASGVGLFQSTQLFPQSKEGKDSSMKLVAAIVLVLVFALAGESGAGGYHHSGHHHSGHHYGGGNGGFWPSFALGVFTGAVVRQYGPPGIYGYPPPVVYGYPPPYGYPLPYGYPPSCNPHTYIRSGGRYCW